MPEPIFMKMVGVRSGEISSGALGPESVGRASMLSHRNKIQVLQYESQFLLPSNPQTGQPSGRREHHGITVHKYFDKSSPDIHGMLATGEELSSVTLEFWRIPPDGEEEQYFEIKAERCTLVNIRTYVPNVLDPLQRHMGHMEAVTFKYRKITWTHKLANTSRGDDWDK
jgi:type VI secretion system secreted protein Hcp